MRVFAAFSAVLLCACSNIEYNAKAGLAVTRQTDRNFVVDYGGGAKGDSIRRCLEAPGPAALLKDFKLDTELSGDAAKVSDAKIEVDVKNTESIAKLYEISSILQYTHAMSYRLCEAVLNGFMNPADYGTRFDLLVNTTTHLLEKQIELTREEKGKAEAEAKKAEAEVQRQLLRK
jgi:hypothetical protein